MESSTVIGRGGMVFSCLGPTWVVAGWWPWSGGLTVEQPSLSPSLSLSWPNLPFLSPSVPAAPTGVVRGGRWSPGSKAGSLGASGLGRLGLAARPSPLLPLPCFGYPSFLFFCFFSKLQFTEAIWEGNRACPILSLSFFFITLVY